MAFGRGPGPEAIDRLLPDDASVLSDWSILSNGLTIDRAALVQALDAAVARFTVDAFGVDLLGIVTRFRPRDQVAALRLLPLGGARLCDIPADGLEAIVAQVRRRLLLRKVYLYTADPIVGARSAHPALPLEGRLAGCVPFDGRLHPDAVFASYEGPVPPRTFTPPPGDAPAWVSRPLPVPGLEGARARLEPLLEPTMLGLFDEETADPSWRDLGMGVTFAEYVDSVRTNTAVALAIRHRATGDLVGRVSVFDWHPRRRRARLSVYLRDAPQRVHRLAGAEGIVLGVLHAMHALGLETLCLDTTASTTSRVAGTLRAVASHDAHFPEDVRTPSGFVAADAHSLSRASVQQFCERLGLRPLVPA